MNGSAIAQKDDCWASKVVIFGGEEIVFRILIHRNSKLATVPCYNLFSLVEMVVFTYTSPLFFSYVQSSVLFKHEPHAQM